MSQVRYCPNFPSFESGVMTKEAFIAKYRDELCGFVLAAFIQDAKPDMAMKGRFMLNQMHQAVELLGRIFSELTPRTLEEVKADAQALSEADRAKLRAWIESQPRKNGPTK